MRGYDQWKATEPDRPADEDTCCHECGEEHCVCIDETDSCALCGALGDCECYDGDEPEAVTDEQVVQLVAELREKRAIVKRVEDVLAGLEKRQRDERPHADQIDDEPAYATGVAHGHIDELEGVVALLRAALGTAT